MLKESYLWTAAENMKAGPFSELCKGFPQLFHTQVWTRKSCIYRDFP